MGDPKEVLSLNRLLEINELGPLYRDYYLSNPIDVVERNITHNYLSNDFTGDNIENDILRDYLLRVLMFDQTGVEIRNDYDYRDKVKAVPEVLEIYKELIAQSLDYLYESYLNIKKHSER